MQLIGLAGSACRAVLDFALPPRCPGCGEIVGGDHQFCLGCWQSLTFLGAPCCNRCGLPFQYEQPDLAECGACLAEPPAFDRLRAAVAYGDIARAVVLKLKYGGRPAVAATLAHFMRRHFPDASSRPIVAPVPLHRGRIWRRGYNQSALIASALAKGNEAEVRLDLIRRVKATPPMKGMSRSQRARTVSGAFALRPEAKGLVAGRHILLIDDVFTTGATVEACARLLKRAGAARVDILCWARVVREHDD